jgi:hypothetical protein
MMLANVGTGSETGGASVDGVAYSPTALNRDRRGKAPSGIVSSCSGSISAGTISDTKARADCVDSRIIQLMLGHGSIQQTQRYLSVTDEELRRGLEVSWNNKGRPLRLAAGA